MPRSFLYPTADYFSCEEHNPRTATVAVECFLLPMLCAYCFLLLETGFQGSRGVNILGLGVYCVVCLSADSIRLTTGFVLAILTHKHFFLSFKQT